METKTVTLRLPQDIADYIIMKADGGSITEGVKEIVDNLRRHERYADVELQGMFTPAEWKFLADSLNGTMTLDDFRFVPDMLVGHNQDSQLYDNTADTWGVDLKALNAKCAALTATQTDALYRRIEKFWANCNDVDIEDWAQY